MWLGEMNDAAVGAGVDGQGNDETFQVVLIDDIAGETWPFCDKIGESHPP